MQINYRRFRRPALLVLVVCALVVSAYGFRRTIAPLFAFALLSYDQPKPGADAIVVLMGEYVGRPAKGAEAFHNKISDKVYVAEVYDPALFWLGLAPSSTSVMIERLVSEHVPRKNIYDYGLRRPPTSTVEEAKAFRDHIMGLSPKPTRVVIVTSWYHTSRARWIFKKVFKGTGVQLEMLAAYSQSSPVNWWKTEGTFLEVFTEYVKWLYYLLKYGFRDLSGAP